MSPSEQSTKRRRVSEERPEPEVARSTGASSSMPQEQEDEIPKLLFVEIQKDDGTAVVVALKRLLALIPTKKTQSDDQPWTRFWEEEIRHLGPIGLVVLCMRKWADNEGIQMWSVRVLVNMTWAAREDTVSKIAFAQSGGVDDVVKAMKKFPRSSLLVGFSIGVLQNGLFAGAPNRIVPDVVDRCQDYFMYELEGVKLIVSALQQFSDRGVVLHFGCLLLDTLAGRGAYHETLVKHGAAKAMKKVQKEQRWVLGTTPDEFFAKLATWKNCGRLRERASF